MITQLAFNLSAGTAALLELDNAARARAHWRSGMVTSLPLFCEIEGIGGRYSYMLPGVVEAIAGDLADVRIYAAPEYGYVLEGYPLHLALAVDVPLSDLGRCYWHSELQRIADEGLLVTGDAQLAAEVRARANCTHEREIAQVPA
jgi:hypothetical protein